MGAVAREGSPAPGLSWVFHLLGAGCPGPKPRRWRGTACKHEMQGQCLAGSEHLVDVSCPDSEGTLSSDCIKLGRLTLSDGSTEPTDLVSALSQCLCSDFPCGLCFLHVLHGVVWPVSFVLVSSTLGPASVLGVLPVSWRCAVALGLGWRCLGAPGMCTECNQGTCALLSQCH